MSNLSPPHHLSAALRPSRSPARRKSGGASVCRPTCPRRSPPRLAGAKQKRGGSAPRMRARHRVSLGRARRLGPSASAQRCGDGRSMRPSPHSPPSTNPRETAARQGAAADAGAAGVAERVPGRGRAHARVRAPESTIPARQHQTRPRGRATRAPAEPAPAVAPLPRTSAPPNNSRARGPAGPPPSRAASGSDTPPRRPRTACTCPSPSRRSPTRSGSPG